MELSAGKGEGLFASGPPTSAYKAAPQLRTQRMKAKVEEVQNVDAMNATHPAMLPFGSPDDYRVEAHHVLTSPPPGLPPLFFMQLPSALPSGSGAPKERTNDIDKEVATRHAAIAALGSGHIGKLKVYESGRMQLAIGDVLYDVTPGLRPSFLQQVAVMSVPPPPPPQSSHAPPPPQAPAGGGAASAHPSAPPPDPGKLYVLGPVHDRLVAVPNVTHCLRCAVFSSLSFMLFNLRLLVRLLESVIYLYKSGFFFFF